MSKIKGQNLVVLFQGADMQWKALAYATQCELDIQLSMLEVGSADSGDWQHFKGKKKGWKITCAHLLSDVEQPIDIDDILFKGAKIKVTFTCVEDHPIPKSDPPQYEPDYRFYGPPYGYVYTRTGTAIVARHTVTARHRTYVASSLELTGSGPLVKGLGDQHDFGPQAAPDFGPQNNPDFNI